MKFKLLPDQEVEKKMCKKIVATIKCTVELEFTDDNETSLQDLAFDKLRKVIGTGKGAHIMASEPAMIERIMEGENV